MGGGIPGGTGQPSTEQNQHAGRLVDDAAEDFGIGRKADQRNARQLRAQQGKLVHAGPEQAGAAARYGYSTSFPQSS